MSYDGDAPSWPDSGGRPFGCQGSGCNGSSPGTLAGAVVSAYAGVDGTATAALVGEWPSTVVCGSETALVTWGVDEDGAEGWLPPALGVLGFLYSPGGGTFDDPGHLVTDTEAGLMVSTDIAALAGGGVQYAAPACDVVAAPVEIGVAFMVTTYGVSGAGTITVLPAGAGGTPDTLRVSVTPGTLGPGEAAAVTAVAQADGSDIPDGTIPDSTRMTVLVSSALHGFLVHDGVQGPVLDGVSYGALRTGAVQFVAADTVAAPCGVAWIGVFGAGLSGEVAVEVATGVGNDGFAAPPISGTTGDGGMACGPPFYGAPPDWSVARLAHALEADPYGLLDVPCDQIASWADVGSHVPPPLVLDRLQNQEAAEPWWNSAWGDWDVQELTEAAGALVNMDYYAVTLRLPEGESAGDYFEHVRRNLNDFISSSLAEFRPYAGDSARWADGPVLATIGHFDVFQGGLNVEDLAVIVSDYEHSSEGGRWRFTTIWSPGTWGHPVSGTREFGLAPNGDSTYTFYTRGVDRLAKPWDRAAATLSSVFGSDPNAQFQGADALWRSLQEFVESDIDAWGGGAGATVVPPTVYRPDWEEVRGYFERTITLDDLLHKLDCDA